VRTRPHLGDVKTPIPSILHTDIKILANGQVGPVGSIIECSTSSNQIFALGMMPVC
jgi:hypothetical protein